MNVKQRDLAVRTVVGLARTLYPNDVRMLKLLGSLQNASPKQFRSALRAVKARGDRLARAEAARLTGDGRRFTFSGAVDQGIKLTLESYAQK